MSKCLICKEEIYPFISFGRMPIANGFLTNDQFNNEYFFELKVGFCPNCTMVQLAEIVNREKMFHKDYAFFSSTSAFMGLHFQKFAEMVIKKYLQSPDPLVVEIGSNDGILLQHFAKHGIRHLGIEPSENVAQIARDKGIHTICEFFDQKIAHKIVEEYGQVDVFLAANVMCHIPYLHSVVEGIRTLLQPKGIVIFEDPYLGDIIEKISYDQIYDEHAFYFTLTSISYLFSLYDLEVVDVQAQNVHGGSMRYFIAHRGVYPISPAVAAQKEKEYQLSLQKPSTFDTFRRKIEQSRYELMSLLYDLKQQGKLVVGYAATSKSTTVINYCGITQDILEYISDTTPIKQGKYSPGAHIPIRPYDDFKANYPDYALLFGWNHAEEIMTKEQPFRAAGGKWIVYVPKVQVIE